MKAYYRGIADDMIRLVEQKQLKDRKLWELVTKQFEGTPDDADHGWRGEYWGKLMRGACMTWQYTKDQELYSILREAVTRLLAAQDEYGRISTYSREAEFHGWDIWCRKYVLLGLIHFYEICGEEALRMQVLEAAGKHLDYIIAHIGDGEGKKRITLASDGWLGINSSSILEPVVRLYMLKPQKRYLEFADYIVENGGAEGFSIFQAAYDDRLYPYQYPVVKAYELMSCFEGLLCYAQVKKSEKWRQAVIRFADRLLESEATVVGGSGCLHELFNHSSLMQTGTAYDGLMLETCVTVTWMKFLYRVYELTGDMKYLEEVERSAFNALYGAVNTQYSTCGPEATFDEPYYRSVYDCAVSRNGGEGQIFDSYSPLRSGIRGRAVGGFKSMERETEYYGCCMAIGAAGCALVPAAAARDTEAGVEIGMYLPGKIAAAAGGMRAEFCIESDYPVGGNVTISVALQREEDLADAWRQQTAGPNADKKEQTSAGEEALEAAFEIALRIPSFAESGRIAVNGKDQGQVQAGTFLRLNRSWKNGDCIRLSLEWGPRLAYGMDNPEDPASSRHIAVLYGPLALARDKRLGEEGVPVCLQQGKVSVKKTEEPAVACQCSFDVTLDDGTFPMIDYASAGKTWRRDSEMEVWMRTCF